jgi:predicted  nucleic acid-binding Zn-ribbon protein
MVDSWRDEVMADRIDRLEERIDVVEGKVDQLASAMSAGFRAVDEALREQREYTEFCFVRLEARMDAGFAKIDERFGKMESGLARVERKLDQFIDVQSRTNDLVERRLRALE